MAAGGPAFKRRIHNLSQHSAILTTKCIAAYCCNVMRHIATCYIPSSIFPSSLGTWPTRQAPRPLRAKDLSRFASGVPTCVALGWSCAERSPCFSKARVKFGSCFATGSCRLIYPTRLLPCERDEWMQISLLMRISEDSAIHHVQQQ